MLKHFLFEGAFFNFSLKFKDQLNLRNLREKLRSFDPFAIKKKYHKIKKLNQI